MTAEQSASAGLLDVAPLATQTNGASKVGSRGKYISKACIPCRISKSKCGGGTICQNCLRQDKTCTYPARARIRKSKAASAEKERRLPVHKTNAATVTGLENDTVLERLRSLEQHINRMDKAFQIGLNDQDHDNHNHNDDPTTTSAESSNMEIFKVATNKEAIASLSSHINALKKALLPTSNHSQASASTSSPPESVENDETRGTTSYLCDLPSIHQIKGLVSLYFEQLNNFFPCIEPRQFRERLAQIEVDDQVVSGEGRVQIVVKPCSRTFLMMMCMVLALATYLDLSNHEAKIDTTPGWRYFLMAEEMAGKEYRLRHECIDLDLVRYHTVKSMYLIHVERLTAASQSIGTAIQLAFNVGLNDETKWSHRSEADQRACRLLWWTIFYMDRRVAQKSWKPYLIRENEFRVEEVEGVDPLALGAAFDMEAYTESESKLLINRYVQTEIVWARLWGSVWDSLFAARALTRAGRAEEIEVLDAKILHAQRQFHQSLQWETAQLSSYEAAGETEGQIRSRLVARVRMNLLRLIIRQSWQRTTADDTRGAQICVQLATETIEAILAFMNSTANPVSFGLTAVECVVEAMCHLVPHLQCPVVQDANSAQYSFTKAVDFLQDLSKVLGVARRALVALGEIADKGWQNVFTMDRGFSLDYMSLSPNDLLMFRQDVSTDMFLSEWPEICLPGPGLGTGV